MQTQLNAFVNNLFNRQCIPLKDVDRLKCTIMECCHEHKFFISFHLCCNDLNSYRGYIIAGLIYIYTPPLSVTPLSLSFSQEEL